MKKEMIGIVMVMLGSLGYFSCVNAENATIATIEMPPAPTDWVSRNATDVVTINNGNASRLVITITVNKGLAASDTVPGVNINNCGQTSHISAGSSAVCVSRDPNNPVSFSSDDPSMPATGTYTVKQGS